MMQTLYTDRSRVQAYQRCKRLRWLEYSEGAAGVGLTPVRKSSHLVVGGAVHAGMEVLLREGQEAVDKLLPQLGTVADALEELFSSRGARAIEDRAVAAALADFALEWGSGVELDPEEARQRQQQQAAAGADGMEVTNDFADLLANPIGRGPTGESPIVVEFGDLTPVPVPTVTTVCDMESTTQGAAQYQPFDQDAWLKEEMAALTEGIVRCWARRRWRSMLESFEILETEREGCWKLAEWGATVDYDIERVEHPATHELYFLSRHDALLLERSTGYLYLQSYKTTGAWDRRKELDAQVDMQGLSEAVDVERRYDEWWHQINGEKMQTYEVWVWGADTTEKTRAIYDFLSKQTSPPTILGVRYEYLLKGPRKENKKAQPGEARWNQESILIRAYKQEGITSDDRRWAWTYDWKDESGKGRRLDYRSWQKSAVWKSMSIGEWIDLLDQGKVQEGALGEDGEPLDALGEQLVPVITQYRAKDEMYDLLEQLEAQEIQVAKDVEAVREAERSGGYSAKRTELNRRFGQNRQACSYPGLCSFRSSATQPGFCFGPPDPEHDPSVLEHFRTRTPNHPKEGLVQIDGPRFSTSRSNL